MGLNYVKIIKQAWLITKTNRFLWGYGLFLTLANLYFSWNGEIKFHLPFSETAISFALFILSISILILFFLCKAGLIIAVKALLDKQETSIRKSFFVARLFYGRILTLSLLGLVLIALLILIIGGPILASSKGAHLVQTLILGSLGAIILIPILFVINFIMVMSPMFIVFYDSKVQEAIRQSMGLVLARWRWLLGFGLILLFIEVVVASLGFLLYFLYHNGSIGSWIIVSLGSILFLGLVSGVQVFQQTAWVLAFQDLIKPEKLAEEEALPEPEIAG